MAAVGKGNWQTVKTAKCRENNSTLSIQHINLRMHTLSASAWGGLGDSVGRRLATRALREGAFIVLAGDTVSDCRISLVFR